MSSRARAFTLLEMLVAMTIVVVLLALVYPAINSAITQARISQSTANLKQLALANLAYAADHSGRYCPAQSIDNNTRWHGARSSWDSPFEPDNGFLAEYLGKDGRINTCPLLEDAVDDATSWELGTGGYGYNAVYIGGTNAEWYSPNRIANVTRAAGTVMFTTTAFAKADGVQEYPYSEPYYGVDWYGNLSWQLQPSTHFRANGKALVAWCDGHVTAEPPNDTIGPNYYGGDNASKKIAWFGPTSDNGQWNPARQP